MRRVCLISALLLGCGDSAGGGEDGSGGATESSGSSSGSSSGASDPTTGAAPTDCSSDRYWTLGEVESPLMHPGAACLACHAKVVGEDIQGQFAIAGTVYPTAHEVDDCYGAPGPDLKVVINAADGEVLTLTVNESGNFMFDQLELGAVAFPIQAKVVRGSEVRAMATPQMTGDCNSCHTAAGQKGAPGRILAP